MKRLLSAVLAALCVFCLAAPAFAGTSGTYSAVYLEYAGMTLDAKNTYSDFTITPHGDTVTMTLQGETLEGSWSESGGEFALSVAEGHINMNGTVDGSSMKIINMLDTGMNVVLEKAGGEEEPAAEENQAASAADKLKAFFKNAAGDAGSGKKETGSPAPAPAAATPAPAKTEKPGVKLSWEPVINAEGYTVYSCAGEGRDASMSAVASLDASASSCAAPDSGRYFCVEAAEKKGGSTRLFFTDGVLTEEWRYFSNGKIDSGEDFVNNISYDYNYDGGAFTGRTVTRKGLNETDFFSWDSERSKIGSSTASTLSPAEVIRSVRRIEFEMEITEVASGQPWGLWRLYGRDANTGKWREYGTFKVNKGEVTHETVSLERKPDIDKLAFLGPQKKYSVSYNISVYSVTTGDMEY